MAPKLTSKRARKQDGEGSSSLPPPQAEFVPELFRSEQHQSRYDMIKDWSFIKEHRVELRPEDFPEFTTELAR